MMTLRVFPLNHLIQLLTMRKTDQNRPAVAVSLVAGDDALRSSVRMLLVVSGMDVHEYRTIRDYVTAPPGWHRCLVVDSPVTNIPDHRLCMEVIRRKQQAPMVVLSAAPEEFELATFAHPNIRAIRKPFEGELLVAAIHESAGAGSDNRDEDRAPRDIYPAAS